MKGPVYLIGSRALAHHARLVGRKPADWDFIVPGDYQAPAVSSPGGRVEFYRAVKTPVDQTTALFYEILQKEYDEKDGGLDTVETPIGPARVASLAVLKALKLSCVGLLGKAKHEWDLRSLSDVALPSELSELAGLRRAEVEARAAAQKAAFFSRYRVERFFEHDRLHLFIAKSPAYLRALRDGVTIDRELFLSLPTKDQELIIREEALVLALERELIPAIQASPAMAYVLTERFHAAGTSESPEMRWLSRLSTRGAIGDHPDWLADWASQRHRSLARDLGAWWDSSLHALPEEFWSSVLSGVAVGGP